MSGYRPENFELRELVPPDVFTARGESAWELLDTRTLMTAQTCRTIFGRIVFNDWHAGGVFKESFLRSFLSGTGAKWSQHRYGRAGDAKPRDVTPQEMHAYILAHPEMFPYLTTFEDIRYTPTWVHFDTRTNASIGIRVVKP